MNGAEVIIPIVLFATIFGVAYLFFTTRNRERMALIEKGADANKFKAKWNMLALKVGMLAIGISCGILIGNLLAMIGMDEEVAFPSMIFLGGGSGLVAFFFLSRKYEDE
jgi:hypothetical protein